MKIKYHIVLYGPSWRGDVTAMELHLLAESGDLEILRTHGDRLATDVRDRLREWGIDLPAEASSSLPDDGLGRFTGLLTSAAVALQRHGGHPVAWRQLIPRPEQGLCIGLFEYEHLEVGRHAYRLAGRLLSGLLPELLFDGLPIDRPDDDSLESDVEAFLKRARNTVLPADARAIIDAAGRRDIPVTRLEHWPYEQAARQDGIRRNGLLKLGHCRHWQIVDGTHCPQRDATARPLLADREAAWQLLKECGVPLAPHDPEFRQLQIRRRIERVAGRLGYPVVVKPRARLQARGGARTLSSAVQLPDILAGLPPADRQVLVEGFVAGDSYRIILSAGKTIAVVDDNGRTDIRQQCHEGWITLAERVAERLPVALMTLTVVTADISGAPETAGGAFVDLDPAPELDAFLPADSPVLAAAMDALLTCLYPPGAPSRVPIVAVTGSNGKTTTTRMTAAILQAAGMNTAFSSTDGSYFNGIKLDDPRFDGGDSHYHLLDMEPVEAVVLETHFGRLARGGFAYRWSDVGICTNVTEEHLGSMGVDTMEQLTLLKQSLLDRVRHVAVLNADDAPCLEMIPRLSARRVCLVSTLADREQLSALAPGDAGFCLVEERDGVDWIVLYDGDDDEHGEAVISVNDMPAAFGGVARFNVANALQAVAASHALGVDPGAMRQALSTFVMDFENTPGRLNLHDNGAFRVLMDYAHNPDGARQLCAFLEQMPVDGRRILLFATARDRRDDIIRATAAELAGHFDHYACRAYGQGSSDRPGRPTEQIPDLMREGLLSAGVAESSITCHYDPEAAITEVLQMAVPGDLVVMNTGSKGMHRMWPVITAFEPETGHARGVT